MDTLLGVNYFSKFALHIGYWQVELKEEEKDKTAFTIGNLGFYECNRMAFGLTNGMVYVRAQLKRVSHFR